MIKSKSKWIYRIDGDVIFIEDLNSGGMSVTNDIENVINDLKFYLMNTIATDISLYHIIYRDSEGRIDGINLRGNEFDSFYGIDETDYESAKLKIKK